ncbi:hypothetical protein M2F92_06570, partial [Klebsiella pneumoniae]|nr:hypothetical protein [Klebsiella pneumoniae]
MNRIKFAFGFFISGAMLSLFYNLLNDKIHHKEECTALMNPLMILVKIIKLRWIHILSYDQMVSRKI